MDLKTFIHIPARLNSRHSLMIQPQIRNCQPIQKIIRPNLLLQPPLPQLRPPFINRSL